MSCYVNIPGTIYSGWWFGTFGLCLFYSVGNVIIPTDFHIFQNQIFFRIGWCLSLPSGFKHLFCHSVGNNNQYVYIFFRGVGSTTKQYYLGDAVWFFIAPLVAATRWQQHWTCAVWSKSYRIQPKIQHVLHAIPKVVVFQGKKTGNIGIHWRCHQRFNPRNGMIIPTD